VDRVPHLERLVFHDNWVIPPVAEPRIEVVDSLLATDDSVHGGDEEQHICHLTHVILQY
jgi:hypothetical protein